MPKLKVDYNFFVFGAALNKPPKILRLYFKRLNKLDSLSIHTFIQ